MNNLPNGDSEVMIQQTFAAEQGSYNVSVCRRNRCIRRAATEPRGTSDGEREANQFNRG